MPYLQLLYLRIILYAKAISDFIEPFAFIFEITRSNNTALGFYHLGVTITIDFYKNGHLIFDGLQNVFNGTI